MLDGLDDIIPGVAGDTSKIESSFTTWPDGELQTTGIHSFISKDQDRGLPIFVAQGDKLVARFKLMVLQVDEETGEEVAVEGPPMSATVEEFRMMVRSFGGDPAKLPAEGTTKFLMDTMDLCSTGKIRRCGVKGGWVKWVEGMNPPTNKDIYLWEFKGFWCESGADPVCFEVRDREFQGRKYQETVAWAKFEIIADAWGNPSIYAGYQISVKVYNPYTGEALEQAGRLYPATIVGEKGGIPVSVDRWLRFLRLYCMPEYGTREWQEDPERSDFGINEIANPLPVVNKLAQKSQTLIVALLGQSKNGGPKLDMNDFGIYKGQPIQQTNSTNPQTSELYTFVTYAEKVAGFPIFEPTAKDSNEINLSFTKAGKTWAMGTLVGAWDTLALPVAEDGQRFLAKLSPEELISLTNYLREQNGDAVADLSEAEGIDSF